LRFVDAPTGLAAATSLALSRQITIAHLLCFPQKGSRKLLPLKSGISSALGNSIGTEIALALSRIVTDHVHFAGTISDWFPSGELPLRPIGPNRVAERGMIQTSRARTSGCLLGKTERGEPIVIWRDKAKEAAGQPSVAVNERKGLRK